MAPELFVWLSPAFPVGAYAYSQGLERAAELGMVQGRADLEAWIRDLFVCGAAKTDLTILAAAYRAVAADDEGVTLGRVNALALALQPSAERYLESTQQGNSFMDAIAATWDNAGTALTRTYLPAPVAYPVAVGATAAARGINLSETLQAFGLAVATSLTSAGIRLSIIGQTDGQRILAAVVPVVHHAGQVAELSTLDSIATSTFSADLASLEHETQYTRLFRS
jgi:urease accessory protein